MGFIKKIMKQMQRDYPTIERIEVQLTQEKEMDRLPNRPSEEASIFHSSTIAVKPFALDNESKMTLPIRQPTLALCCSLWVRRALWP